MIVKKNKMKNKFKRIIIKRIYIWPCDDEDKYFDRSYLSVCKIIS
jgi:hypothetical protein